MTDRETFVHIHKVNSEIRAENDRELPTTKNKIDYDIVRINALDYDSLVEMCTLYDVMIGCWGCLHWTEHGGRSLGCRVHESNFDNGIFNEKILMESDIAFFSKSKAWTYIPRGWTL